MKIPRPTTVLVVSLALLFFFYTKNSDYLIQTYNLHIKIQTLILRYLFMKMNIYYKYHIYGHITTYNTSKLLLFKKSSHLSDHRHNTCNKKDHYYKQGDDQTEKSRRII